MTAQTHDKVRWNDADYLLVGVSGGHLFDPHDHGLVTRPTTTANWRGWVARYTVRDGSLFLDELYDVGLFLDPDAAPPLLFGVEAVSESRASFRYPALHHRLAFTGRLLIAREFIRSLYRHMGFHPAWKFEESWELGFAEGRLTEQRDLSAQMEEMRNRIESGELQDPDDPSRPGWIERTFRLDFRRSKG